MVRSVVKTSLQLLVVAVALSFAFSLGRYAKESNREDAGTNTKGWLQCSVEARNEPIKIERTSNGSGTFSTPQWIQSPFRIPGSRTPSPSLCLHVMRLHGVAAQVLTQDGKQVSALDVVTRSETGRQLNGSPAIVTTDYGIRFPSMRRGSQYNTAGDESHRDQCLSAMGELGVKLTHECIIDGDHFELRDALRDSLANFDISQNELEWSAIAYALYLPPICGWVNRFGQLCSFDLIAEELMRRPMESASCGGTHLLFALTTLIRADETTHVLSDSTRQKVKETLREAVARAVDRQNPDGSWSINVSCSQSCTGAAQPAVRDGFETRLLMTGHLAEWMMYLPEELKAPKEVQQRAEHWLAKALDGFNTDLLGDQLCPVTHAACAICR